MKLIKTALLCLAPVAHAAITNVWVDGVTNTRAVIRYTAPSTAACTVEVSDSSTYSPLVNDVDSALFSGANSDARESMNAGRRARVFIAGQSVVTAAGNGRRYSRALQVFTLHYFRITCAPDTATGTFTTANLPYGKTNPEGPLFDVAAPFNYSVPSIDWTSKDTAYIDPRTGVLVRWQTFPGEIGNTYSPSAFSADYYVDRSGGAITNVQNLGAGSSGSRATFSATGQVGFLPIDTQVDANFDYAYGWDPATSLDDAKFAVNGSCTDSSGVRLKISMDSGQTAVTGNLDVALTSSVTTVTCPGATGCTPSGTWPNAAFGSWPSLAAIPQKGLTLFKGTVTITSGTAVVQSGAFDPHIAAGSKIWVAGSSPTCGHNLCTISSTTDYLHFAVSESVSVTDANFTGANFGVTVEKLAGAGTCAVSLTYGIAYSQTSNNYVGVTPTFSGLQTNGGYNAIYQGTLRTWYWFKDGASKLLSLLVYHGSAPPTPSFGSAAFGAVPYQQFDPVTPNVLYTYQTNSNGGGDMSLYKLTYTGDNNPTIPKWSGYFSWTTDNVTWENYVASMNASLSNAGLGYDVGSFGMPSSQGMTGPYMMFTRMVAGNQDVPGWVLAYDVPNKRWTSGLNTYSSTLNGAFEPKLSWGGLHGLVASDTSPGLSFSALNLLGGSGGYGYSTSPYTMNVLTLKRPSDQCSAAIWCTNTALPDSYDGTYDGTCPDGYAANGCITFRTDGQPCRTGTITGPETSCSQVSPSGKAQLGTLRAGHALQWRGEIDGEGMLVLSVTTLGDGISLEIIALRANRTCPPSTTPNITSHSNGWAAMAIPGGTTCNVSQLAFDASNGTISVRQENRQLANGHAYWGTAPTTGLSALVCQPNQGSNPSNVRIGTFLNVGDPANAYVNNVPLWDGYAGYTTNGLQSYLSGQQVLAPASEKTWGVDFRSVNNGNGTTLFGQSGLAAPVLQAGSTMVYKIPTQVTVDYKRAGLMVFAGRWLLGEKSGPSVTLTDSDLWRWCRAYAAGQCYSGSSAGDVFAVVPKLYSTTQCWTSQYSANVACALTLDPVETWTVQQATAQNDTDASTVRRIWQVWSGPSRQLAFSNPRTSPDGQWALFPVSFVEGYFSGIVAAKLPPWRTDSRQRTTYTQIPITLSAGAGNQAAVEFGYDENSPDKSELFYCVAFQSRCLAGAGNTPFSFSTDTLTLTTCGSGCTINIPAIPGRILYYRTVRYSSGTVVAKSAPQVLAIP